MKKTTKLIRVALSLIVLCGVMYPLGLTLASNVIFPHQAQGSLIYDEGVVVGSELIGQYTDDPRYLMGRPSAHNYGETSVVSGSNNQAVASDAYKVIIEKRKAAFLEANPTVHADEIPNDLLMESASGFDPHISIEAAKIQIARIHEHTGIEETVLITMIEDNEKHGLVNVLSVNLLIDAKINAINPR